MSYQLKATSEEIVNAYKETGSVWKAAKKLNICGQSVWERLKGLGYTMPNRKWSKDELNELVKMSDTMTISRIAEQLGRPYFAVAIKMSRLGLSKKWGNRQKILKRGTGYTKENCAKWVKELKHTPFSLKQFARSNSLTLDSLVYAIQRHYPDDWIEISKSKGMDQSTCLYCGAKFYPSTAKQTFCTRLCSSAKKRDDKYFGGKRRNTVGLAEGVCQLCLQTGKTLASHHVLGKQNDPENDCLIALCNGCHQMVGGLAGRKFVDDEDGWERLIQLVVARRMADKSSEYVGVYACVEMNHLTKDDLENEITISTQHGRD
jgi:5-methylcytosine-specific restriction endonuclease McrA